jgi:hypothetical protein
MNLLTQMFSKTPSARDIRIQLKEIERDQFKKQRDLEALEQTKQERVKQAVAAKKAGNQEVLREVFREMRQIEIDHEYISSDLRRLSLSKTALSSFSRKLELLEKKKDRKSLQNLISRFKDSSLQKAIDVAEVDDDTFNSMLEDILGEEELSATPGTVKEDAGFAAFDKAIGEMAKAEEAGASEVDTFKFLGEHEKTKVKSPDNYPSYGNKPAKKAPDNYPSYGDKPAAKGPDNYPSYGDKPKARITVSEVEECPVCQGKGVVLWPCPTCNGRGSYDKAQSDRPDLNSGDDSSPYGGSQDAEEPQAIRDRTKEPIRPVFAAEAEADADPCADLCVGGTATREKVHG